MDAPPLAPAATPATPARPIDDADDQPLHPDFVAALAAGSSEHYADPDLYDHEYRSRRGDLRWYCRLAADLAAEQPGPPPGTPPSATPDPLRILELGCGSGRLTVPLLRAGHAVCGVDHSAPMLQRLRARLGFLNARTRARVHILQSDFRTLPLQARFPLILCPFNSFLHLYTRRDVERFLAGVRGLLSPGGLFAFDVVHPDPTWLARPPGRRFARTRMRHPTTGERLIYSTSHVYDPETQIAWIQFFYEPDLRSDASATGTRTSEGARRAARGVPARRSAGSGRAAPPAGTRVVRLAQRLFFPAELESLLHYNGFAITYRAGGFDGSPLTPVSSEQVICARVR